MQGIKGRLMVSHVIDFPDHSGAPNREENDLPSPSTGTAPEAVQQDAADAGSGSAIEEDPPDVGEAAGIVGAVERVESNFVVGWASSIDAPHSPVSLELLLDGVVIARCLAAQERPDVAAKKPGIGAYCGFKFSALHDLSQEIAPLAVRVAGGGPELHQGSAFRHSRKARGGMRSGAVARVSGSTIWGWINAGEDAEHQPVEVDLYVDGEWASSTHAILKTSLPSADSRLVKRGFVVRLPPCSIAGDNTCIISLRRKDGAELANSPFALSAKQTFEEAADLPLAPDWIVPAPPKIRFLGTELGCLQGQERSIVACGEKSLRTLKCLWLFSRLARVNPEDVVVRFDESEQSWFAAETNVFSPHLSDVQPVLDSTVAVDDLWFLNESALRLRTGPQLPPAVKEARLFQMDMEGEHLVEVDRKQISQTEFFCDLQLLNPFFPTLVLLLGDDESIEGCTILPFPSLCRGGVHYSELRGEGEFPDYLAGLRRMSRSLVQEFLGWETARPLAIAKLSVDLQGATGAERIFSDDFKHWMCAVLQLKFEPADEQSALPSGTLQYLRDALSCALADTPHTQGAIAARESAGRLTLTVPADAIPTIAALVSRRLRLAENATTQVGSYLLADEGTFWPRLLVSMPAMDASLRALQPANAALAFPLLTGSAAEETSDNCENRGTPILAIRFQAAWHANDSALLYPSAVGAPVFHRSMTAEERNSVLVSVILPLGAPPTQAVRLLRSIAAQTIAGRVEIVAVTTEAAPPEASIQILAKHFAGRHQIVTSDSVRAAQLNNAAAHANGTHLLFVEDSVILHDPRTLEALCLMAMEEPVATAACVTVQEKPHGKTTTLSLASAGFLPTRVSFADSPRLVFSERVASAALPIATYPVVSNAFRLALVRTSAWKKVGGLDVTTFPTSNFDLDFGLRAIKAGYMHLCTSAATAINLGDTPSAEPVDVVSLAYLPSIQWQSVFNRSAVIKELN